MDHTAQNKIVSFIWSIADDCLREVFVRGKYRDVILPMFVFQRRKLDLYKRYASDHDFKRAFDASISRLLLIRDVDTRLQG